MRAAVYNGFWASMGGGERHSGRLGQVLAEEGYDVELIGPEQVDLARLGDHLGLDLSGTRLRVVEAADQEIAELSAQYDVFVNASYMNRLEPRAKTNLYLCYFPTPADHDLGPLRRAIARRAAPYVHQRRPPLLHGTGWQPPEGGRRRSWAWTTGRGELRLPDAGGHLLQMDLGRPGQPEPVQLEVTAESGQLLGRVNVGPAFAPWTVAVPPGVRQICFRSETFVPGPADRRRLGVAVSRLRLAGRRDLAGRVTERFPWLLRDPLNLRWLAAYDRVLANSGYTQGWIRRWWGVESDVLFPPVQVEALHPRAERDRGVLSVGRFFAPGYGHSKRQLEMVRFFGRIVRAGRLPGWRMYVVGGAEPTQQRYVDAVRRAAAGLPVEVLINAPRPRVEELLSSCSVFWSATGYGEVEQRRPWTSEHFGITTVEAMAGGCVPVVIDRAGQREIVRDGVDGYRWSTPAELTARTVRLAVDDELRRQLAASALARSTQFSDGAFAARWREIAADLGLPHR